MRRQRRGRLQVDTRAIGGRRPQARQSPEGHLRQLGRDPGGWPTVRSAERHAVGKDLADDAAARALAGADGYLVRRDRFGLSAGYRPGRMPRSAHRQRRRGHGRAVDRSPAPGATLVSRDGKLRRGNRRGLGRAIPASPISRPRRYGRRGPGRFVGKRRNRARIRPCVRPRLPDRCCLWRSHHYTRRRLLGRTPASLAVQRQDRRTRSPCPVRDAARATGSHHRRPPPRGRRRRRPRARGCLGLQPGDPDDPDRRSIAARHCTGRRSTCRLER